MNKNRYPILESIEDMIISTCYRDSRYISSANEQLNNILSSIKLVFYNDDNNKFNNAILDYLHKSSYTNIKEYNKIEIELIRYLITKEIISELVKIYPKWEWELSNNKSDNRIDYCLEFSTKPNDNWCHYSWDKYRFSINRQALVYTFNRLYLCKNLIGSPYKPFRLDWIDIKDKFHDFKITANFTIEHLLFDMPDDNYKTFDISYLSDMIDNCRNFVLKYSEILSNILLKINFDNR